MRVAVVQLNSDGDKARNLAAAERLVRAAAADGAELVALPEKWNLLAAGEEMAAGAEALDGPSLTAARAWARELGIHLLAGSIAEQGEEGERALGPVRGSASATDERRTKRGKDAGRPNSSAIWPTEDAAPRRSAAVRRARGSSDRAYNTSVLIGPDGADLAAYRKIHMFDVEAGGVAYRESEHEQPGEEIVSAAVGGVELGLTICYDLRFPELYRILALRGARLIAVPSAFTAATGRDHWEVLLRARAIENQAFVIAPDQVGEAPPHYRSHGRSAIVDPWGVVLATAPDEECFAAADLDFAAQAEIREQLPSLANRRPQSYAWPQLLEARA